MPRGRPLADHEIARMCELHAAGAARNEIARELGRSAAFVSKHCARLGLAFDREGTQAATAAKVIDAKARRAQLQLDLLAKAERLLGQIDQPTLAFSFGGKENVYADKTIPEPTFADKRNIVQAVATAVNASIKIDEHDRNMDNPAEVDAWLNAMKGNGE